MEHTGTAVEAEIRTEHGLLGRVRVSGSTELDDAGTPWVSGCLPIAMQRGTPLVVDGGVDPQLLRTVPAAMRILAGWNRGLTKIPVRPARILPEAPPDNAGRGMGCFFSGGVDSLHSAVSNLGRGLTHLIFVHGLDIPEGDPRADVAVRNSREFARRLGIPLLELSTDLRTVADRYADWGPVYHGAALAMCGLLLSPVLSRVLIPASFSPEFDHPWGTHPDLDPLWSSSRVTFQHVGAEATRPQKVGVLAEHPFALEHLRVCWEHRGAEAGQLNCGRCEKCVRTLVNLRVVGAAGRCPTLPEDLTPEQLQRLPRIPGRQRPSRENLEELLRRGRDDPDLEAALRRRLRYDDLNAAEAAARAAARRALRSVLVR